MVNNLIILLIVGFFVGAAAGYIGSFMVLKRMSLVGDALSHVALPGIAIALSLHISPMLGAFAALLIAVVGVWYFEKTSSIYPEALVGIFFTTSLALGILITPKPDLLEALFGNIETITIIEGILACLLSFILIIIARRLSKDIILGIISPELAFSQGVNLSRVNLVYLILVGAIVALGVKFVGTLLMGALVIIPAATAKNISSGIHSYHFFSCLFGVLSAVLGVLIAGSYHTSSGPIVVLSSIAFFLLSYLYKKVSKI